MRLALCDDHGMFLDALATALTHLGHEIVSSSECLDDVEAQTTAYQPDVCLLDVGFSERSGVDVAPRIRERSPQVRLLLLTGMADDKVWHVYDAGEVDGVVNKVCDIAVLNKAITRVAAGGRVVEGFTRPISRRIDAPRSDGLTSREREVLWLLTKGISTENMAAKLGVSTNTVRTHVQNVLHKLGVNGRSKAVHLAMHMDLPAMAAAGE